MFDIDKEGAARVAFFILVVGRRIDLGRFVYWTMTIIGEESQYQGLCFPSDFNPCETH